MEKKDKPVLRHFDADGYKKWRQEVDLYIRLHGADGFNPRALIASDVLLGIQNQWQPLIQRPWAETENMNNSDFFALFDRFAARVHSSNAFMRDISVKRYKDGSLATMELVGDLIRLSEASNEPLQQKQEFLREILKSEPELCLARRDAEDYMAANPAATIPQVLSHVAVSLSNGSVMKQALQPALVNFSTPEHPSKRFRRGGNRFRGPDFASRPLAVDPVQFGRGGWRGTGRGGGRQGGRGFGRRGFGGRGSFQRNANSNNSYNSNNNSNTDGDSNSAAGSNSGAPVPTAGTARK